MDINGTDTCGTEFTSCATDFWDSQATVDGDEIVDGDGSGDTDLGYARCDNPGHGGLSVQCPLVVALWLLTTPTARVMIAPNTMCVCRPHGTASVLVAVMRVLRLSMTARSLTKSVLETNNRLVV